jgi:hypothetical protein
MWLASCSRPAAPPSHAEYDPDTGRLRLLAYDSGGKGKDDTFVHMDGTRLLRVEHDLNRDGVIDRWEFFTEGRAVAKVGFSSQDDGLMDLQAFYEPDGTLARFEVSTKRDGTFDRVEFYKNGLLVRSVEDTNSDGRPDKWDTYRPLPTAGPGEPSYAITSTAFDESGSGHPERRFIYGPNGSIERVELGPNIGRDLFE